MQTPQAAISRLEKQSKVSLMSPLASCVKASGERTEGGRRIPEPHGEAHRLVRDRFTLLGREAWLVSSLVFGRECILPVAPRVVPPNLGSDK